MAFKKPEHVRQIEKALHIAPWQAFLPKNRKYVHALDAWWLDKLKHDNRKYRGLTEPQLRATPEFVASQSVKTGIPRYLLPHQMEIVASPALERYMMGANKCGKTLLSAMEAAWWANGEHPCRDVPQGPNYIWACCQDYANVGKPTNKPLLAWALGAGRKGSNAKWKEGDRCFVVKNPHSEEPARIVLKGYDSGPEKFTAADLDFIMWDECPPEPVWNEGMARIGENPLNVLVTMTPLYQSAYLRVKVHRPWQEAGRPKEKCFVSFHLDSNSYIAASERERFKARYVDDPDAYKIRVEGEWAQIGGLAYESVLDHTVHLVDDFDIPGVHCEPEPGEKPWTLYRFIDPGIRNDCFVGWLAVRPDGLCFVYREWSQADRSIPEVCSMIRAVQTPHEKQRGFQWTTIDEAAKQRDLGSGLRRLNIFAENGIHCLSASNKEVSDAVSEVREWLMWKKDDEGNFRREPRLRVFKSCTTLWRQMRNASWKEKSARTTEDPKEVLLKKDDHGENALRYLLTNYGGPVYVEPDPRETNFDEVEPDSITGWV